MWLWSQWSSTMVFTRQSQKYHVPKGIKELNTIFIIIYSFSMLRELETYLPIMDWKLQQHWLNYIPTSVWNDPNCICHKIAENWTFYVNYVKVFIFFTYCGYPLLFIFIIVRNRWIIWALKFLSQYLQYSLLLSFLFLLTSSYIYIF